MPGKREEPPANTTLSILWMCCCFKLLNTLSINRKIYSYSALAICRNSSRLMVSCSWSKMSVSPSPFSTLKKIDVYRLFLLACLVSSLSSNRHFAFSHSNQKSFRSYSVISMPSAANFLTKCS